MYCVTWGYWFLCLANYCFVTINNLNVFAFFFSFLEVQLNIPTQVCLLSVEKNYGSENPRKDLCDKETNIKNINICVQ